MEILSTIFKAISESINGSRADADHNECNVPKARRRAEVNVNGNGRACEGCGSSFYLGTNQLGMNLYGCKKKVDGCRRGLSISAEANEAAKTIKDKSCTGATE